MAKMVRRNIWRHGGNSAENMSTPLVIVEETREQIKKLCALAEANPVDIQKLSHEIQTVGGKSRHMEQMTRQSLFIPLGFWVVYSIEHGQPVGPCRHLSMSVCRAGRIPNEHALWMVAQEFGFWGSLSDCAVWPEKLLGHGEKPLECGTAINVIQALTKLNPS